MNKPLIAGIVIGCVAGVGGLITSCVIPVDSSRINDPEDLAVYFVEHSIEEGFDPAFAAMYFTDDERFNDELLEAYRFWGVCLNLLQDKKIEYDTLDSDDSDCQLNLPVMAMLSLGKIKNSDIDRMIMNSYNADGEQRCDGEYEMEGTFKSIVFNFAAYDKGLAQSEASAEDWYAYIKMVKEGDYWVIFDFLCVDSTTAEALRSY